MKVAIWPCLSGHSHRLVRREVVRLPIRLSLLSVKLEKTTLVLKQPDVKMKYFWILKEATVLQHLLDDCFNSF